MEREKELDMLFELMCNIESELFELIDDDDKYDEALRLARYYDARTGYKFEFEQKVLDGI